MNPYGASKLAAEAMCDAHALSHPGLSVASLRLFCVYGPRCRPDLALSKFSRLMLAGDPVPVYGNMDAISRDYTFVDDVVGGILAAEAASRPGHLVCNLGNGSPVSLRDATGPSRAPSASSLLSISAPATRPTPPPPTPTRRGPIGSSGGGPPRATPRAWRGTRLG